MSTWRDEYVASIREADDADPVNASLLATCTALQDQVAALQAENALLRDRNDTDRKNGNNAIQNDSKDDPKPDDTSSTTAQLRVDLAEALRAQNKLQSRLRTAEQELATLRTTAKADARAVRSLTSERNGLAVKVRDRDEELRGKLKLVEDVQDELIALNLQLTMAEKQRDEVRRENKELVDRWMKRMGQEAEAMNMANEPLVERRG